MTQTIQAVILLSRGGYGRAPQEQINKHSYLTAYTSVRRFGFRYNGRKKGTITTECIAKVRRGRRSAHHRFVDVLPR